MEALAGALLVCDGRGDIEGTLRLCRTYLARLNPSTVADYVTEAALTRILGRPVGPVEPWLNGRNWEEQVSEAVGLAWLDWAAGAPDEARRKIHALRAKRKSESFNGRTGAIHLLTLAFWSEAILLSIDEDREGARRFYKRALELGSQLGTDSHPMISWAYAATFFISAT